MADEEYRKIFAQNLKRYMEKNGKNQMDLMNDLHLSSSTVSNWCTGLKLPRMDKVQLLADYFRINKSDLIEERDNNISNEHYYLDEGAREMAQFMLDNPEYRVLFDASRKVKKEDIDFVKQMMDRMRGDFDDTGC